MYDKLIAAFAPSIWELDDVKRGVLCQLFGGTTDAAKAKARRGREEGVSFNSRTLQNDLIDDNFDDFYDETNHFSQTAASNDTSTAHEESAGNYPELLNIYQICFHHI